MKAKRKKRSLPVRILSGMLLGFLLSLIALSVCAFVVTKKDVALSHLPVMILISCALGCAVCAFANAKQLEMRGIVSGLLSAALLTFVYILILLICSGFMISGWLAALIAVDLIVGAIAGIAAKNIK